MLNCSFDHFRVHNIQKQLFELDDQNQKNPKLKMHSKFYTKHFQMHATDHIRDKDAAVYWMNKNRLLLFIHNSECPPASPL